MSQGFTKRLSSNAMKRISDEVKLAGIRQQQNDECADSSTRCKLPISSVLEE